MSKLKVAVIGHGHLGKWHTQKVSNISESMPIELYAIIESNQENHDLLKNKYQGVHIKSNLEDVLGEIDAAIVVTPTSTHFELAKLLLKNQKHVFCEKPLTATLEEAIELKNYHVSGNVLQVGHSERYHEVWSNLKPLISKDKQVTLKINRFAPFKGRATDVDVVQDLMIHDLDLASFLLEDEVVKVAASGHKIRTGKWDEVVAMLTFKKGSVCIIHSGRNNTHEVRELQLLADSAVHTVDLMNNKYSFATGDSKALDGSYVTSSHYEKRDHLYLEQLDFYNSILNGAPIKVDYNDGTRAVKLVEAVINSLKSRGPIEL